MSDDLESELKAINGIGDAKAAQILQIVDEYRGDPSRLLQKAIDAAERGDDRTAAVYLTRAGGE